MTRSIIYGFESDIWCKFKQLWKYYFLQSLLATAALSILVLILGRDKMLTISAIGATTFILFAMPNTMSAKPKIVIGSYLVGFTSGAILWLTALPYFIEYPCAVGIAIFLMVFLDVEHPPAAGSALAVVMNEVSLEVFVTIMISALLLSLCRYCLRGHLKNLI